MRLYRNVGPYHGRAPELAPRAGGGQALRRPSKPEPKIRFWSEPRAAHAPQGHFGDVKDAHLTGKGNPFSAAHVGKKK